MEEAIGIDPRQADYFSWLAAYRYDGGLTKDALTAAEQGLEIDPQNVGCINLRALALGRLGRTREAKATSLDSLARDPVNAISHAIQGTTLLRQAEYGLALASFLEALRLDATCEWAHRGRRKARLGFGLIWPAWAIGHSLHRLASLHSAHFKEPTAKRAGWLGSLVLVSSGALLIGAACRDPAVAFFLLFACLLLLGLSWCAHRISGSIGRLLLRICQFISLVLIIFSLPALLLSELDGYSHHPNFQPLAFLWASVAAGSFLAFHLFLTGLIWANILAEGSLPRRRKN
jgi:tetratricopeptide (TPR) repeat protein